MNTRGKFILNMTGRGHVLGMNAKMSQGNCKGLTKCAGKRAACCVGVGGPKCCEFPGGGKPAPQMGYGVYLNRKSKGAYHPSGGKQCKTLSGCKRAKTVWKQHSNLDASVVITNKKDNVLACNSDVYTAKRDTCTGCPVGATGNFTVGQSDVAFGFADSDNDLLHLGAFVPPIINGNTVISLLWARLLVPSAFVLGAVGILGETMFSSISFVNCEEKTVRTYYQGGHDGYTKAEFATGANPDFSFWVWKTASSGFSVADEQTYWQGAVGKTLQVYIDNPNPPLTCPQCCCPVKKNICGCRATDLVRYTRINKSFGCQTTKAVRMGRTASEQIARNRAKVDCIKPMHRTIYLTGGFWDGTDEFIKFDGCCGDQCLIPGQQYTFIFTETEGNRILTLRWCEGLTETWGWDDRGKYTRTFTVPKFNNNCKPASQLQISCHFVDQGVESCGNILTLDYCKQAFKRPQMLGSCSGR